MIIPDAARKRNESIQNEVIDAFIVERRLNPNLDAGLWLKENFDKYKKTATQNHDADLIAKVTNRVNRSKGAFDAAIKIAQQKGEQDTQNRLVREKNEWLDLYNRGLIDKNGNAIKASAE